MCVLQKWQVLAGGSEDINHSGGQLAERPTSRVPRAQWIALPSCLFPTPRTLVSCTRKRGRCKDPVAFPRTCGFAATCGQSHRVRN